MSLAHVAMLEEARVCGTTVLIDTWQISKSDGLTFLIYDSSV